LAADRFFAGQVRECDRQVEQDTAPLVELCGEGAGALPEPAPERPGKRQRPHAPVGDVRASRRRLTGVYLTAIPGFRELTAEGLVGETGLDMSHSLAKPPTPAAIPHRRLANFPRRPRVPFRTESDPMSP
jgi:hypothetical protein